MLVPIDKIKVGERFRKEYGDIEELADSMRRYGLVHPIVVTKDMDLVAGERRLRAAQLLGWGEIEVRVLDDLDEFERRDIELEENIRRKNFEWAEEVRALAELHKLRQKLYGKAIHGHESGGWGLKETAQAVGKSQASVSMDIKLAEGLSRYPELAKAKNKSTAMRMLQKMEEARLLKELRRRQAELGETPPDLYNDDCLNILPKLDSESVDLIIADPPWGVDIRAVDRKRGTITEYSDKRFASLELHDAILREAYRLLKPGGHMYWFFAMDRYVETVPMIERIGFGLDRVPIIWDKGQATVAATGHSYADSYEAILYCWKGDSPRRLTGTPRNILQFPMVPGQERIHSAQKPVALLREFIDQSSVVGDTVLDPCMGSGASIRAARQAGRRGIGIERDPAIFQAAVEFIEGASLEGESKS